jgi:O-antigen/teichoic acid export membrane protein
MTEIPKGPGHDYFDDKDVRRDLKDRAIQSGTISVITRAVNTVILIGGVMALSRLLSPDDYGLVTMATVFTNFFSNFQELGLTDATIQASRLKHEQVNMLFWINSAVGVAIMIILIGLSPVAAAFYKKPQVTLIMMISSVGFLFAGLTTQHIALLKRHLLFSRVMVIETVSNVLGIAGAVGLALIGGGYWAIVSRPLFAAFVTMVLAWVYCRWRPGMPKRGSDVRPLLKVGANSIGFYLVEYFTTNLDKTFIGKRYGADDLGHYSRAYYLATTPSGQFTQSLFHVAVSTLSKLRENAAEYRRYYLKSIAVISFLGMPISVFMVVMSYELIFLLLGPQWDKAAALFSLLGLSAGMKMLYWTQGWIHVSLGRTDRWLRWGILSAVITVGGFLWGSYYGAKGVSIAFSASIILLTFPGILYAGRPVGLRLGHVLSAMWRYTCASILAGMLVYALKAAVLLNAAVLLKMIICLSVYVLAYVVLVIILYWSLEPVTDMLHLFLDTLRNLFSKRGAGTGGGSLTS